jgi:hypothetical protein
VEPFSHRNWQLNYFHRVNTRVFFVRSKSSNLFPLLPSNINDNNFNPPNDAHETSTMGQKPNKKDKPKEGSSFAKSSPKSSNLQDTVAWAAAQEVSRSEAVKLAAATKANCKSAISPNDLRGCKENLRPCNLPIEATIRCPNDGGRRHHAPLEVVVSWRPSRRRLNSLQIPRPPRSWSVRTEQLSPQWQICTGGHSGKVSFTSLAASAAMLEDPLEASLARARAIADGI